MSETQPDPSPPSRKGKRRKPIRTRWLLLGMAGIALCLIVLIYTVTLLDKPDPSIDYLAMLNAPALATPEADRAWPLYRKLIIQYNLRQMTSETIPGFGPAPVLVQADGQPKFAYEGYSDVIHPDDERWPEAAASIKAHEDLYAQLRLATKKPSLGLIRQFEYEDEDQLALWGTQGPPAPSDEDALDDWIGYSPSPFNGLVYKLTKVMEPETRLAIHQQDWPRVLADLEVYAGLARHARQPEIFGSEGVSANPIYFLLKQANDLLLNNARELPDSFLSELALLLESLDELEAADPQGAIQITLDQLQHLYGSSGRISYQGSSWILSNDMGSEDIFPPAFSASDYNANKMKLPLLMPLLALATARHSEAMAQTKRIIELEYKHRQLPLWEMMTTSSEVHRVIDHWKASSSDRARYWVVMYVCLNIHPDKWAYLKLRMAQRDALLTAIALEQYRRKNSEYPASLSALVPDELKELPLDHSTGQPLLYKLVNGSPLLYGRGRNGNDDGGVIHPDPIHDLVPDQGDWVLYPMPE